MSRKGEGKGQKKSKRRRGQYARSEKSLNRRPSSRNPKERILIVCEGSKTEPSYFQKLRVHYRLSAVQVEIRGDGGNAPISVVNHALDLKKSAEKK